MDEDQVKYFSKVSSAGVKVNSFNEKHHHSVSRETFAADEESERNKSNRSIYELE